jgi:hypothetical protein
VRIDRATFASPGTDREAIVVFSGREIRWQEIERQVERLGFGDLYIVSATHGNKPQNPIVGRIDPNLKECEASDGRHQPASL